MYKVSGNLNSAYGTPGGGCDESKKGCGVVRTTEERICMSLLRKQLGIVRREETSIRGRITYIYVLAPLAIYLHAGVYAK